MYRAAMRSGGTFHVSFAKEDVTALGIKDHDELMLVVSKTGRTVERKRKDIIKPYGVEKNEQTEGN